MTLTAMLAELYRRGRYSSSPDATVTTRLTAFLNEAQQELAEHPQLQSLLRGELTFATVANQAEYGLPPVVGRLVNIRDTTNRWPLTRQSLAWYRSVLPNQTSQTGTPTNYVDLGPKPVLRQPASTGVWAVSTSAADVAQTVLLDVVRAAGRLQSTGGVLNGTIRVAVSGPTDVVEITDAFLSATTVGDVSLFDAAAGGNVLATIQGAGVAPQTRATHQWIGFAPTPSAAITYSLDYERVALDLTSGTDEPLWLPVAFHRLMTVGARRKEYEYQGDDRLAVATQDWAAGLQKLITFVNNPPEQILVPGASRQMGRSDLGPNYPNGTIWG